MAPINSISFACPNCRKTFTRHYNLRIHMIHLCKGGSSTWGKNTPKHTSSSNMSVPAARYSDSEDDFIETSKSPKTFTRPNIIPESEDSDDDQDMVESSQPTLTGRKTCFIESEGDSDIDFINMSPKPITINISKTRVQCPQCKKSFSRRNNLKRHMNTACPVTKRVFAPVTDEEGEESTQRAYERSVAGSLHEHRCPKCDKVFLRKDNVKLHLQRACPTIHANQSFENVRLRRGQINPIMRNDVLKTQSAYNNYLTNYLISNINNAVESTQFLEEKREVLKNILQNEIIEKGCIKFNLTLESVLQAPDGTVTDWGIVTENEAIFVECNVDDIINEMYDTIRHRLEEQMIKGSGWTIVSLQSILLKCSKYEPLRGSSYIPLPKLLVSKKAIINPQNFDDNECFKWSILASLQFENAHRINNLRPYENHFVWEGLNFPVALSDIKIFERNNQDVSICVYALDEDNKIYPVRYSTPKARHFDLLLLQKDDVFHYTYIQHFNRLFSTQVRNHHGIIHICKRCMVHYNDEWKLQEHMEHCIKHPLARVVMPEAKNKTVNGEKITVYPRIEFENAERSLPVPMCIYADSEALLKETEDVNIETDPIVSSTIRKQHHIPMSFGYVVASTIPSSHTSNIPTGPVIIRDQHPTKTFIKQLIEISNDCKVLYSRNIKMTPLTVEEQQLQNSATRCYMCEKPFTQNDEAIRDHCHITGQYRGPAHSSCNLKASNPNFLPVYLHNLSKYDAHFLIKEFGSIDAEIRVIPNTTECMISFSIVPKDGIEIRFIDSCRFMASSLESLVNNLENSQFINVQRHFGSTHIDLLRRKGVFCNDYVDDLLKLEQTTLPPRKDFHSKLYECEISEEEYQHAQEVWNAFHCKNLGEYSDLYLKLDVLLLADVFEAFRKVCMDTYHLDPCWYYTSPGLAWDAALRYTKVKLDLIQDEEMLFMIERGIRGGVAQCSKRFATVENRYLDSSHQGNGDYIAYLDANNLYGWAMSQHLPTHDFEWVNLNVGDIQHLDPEGRRGYILEVDVQYPETLHDRHADLPFLPENRIPPGGKQPKLLTTLYNKTKYIIHYRALQQAISHGLKVTRVHRAIAFKQSQWLKSYINLNTEMRKQSKNAFEKDFFKLMNNAVYGKTMENVRNRINMELVNDKKRLRKLIKSPFFKSRIIYNENLCAVTSQKKKVVMNKAIYVGMSILDISKTLMYDFHYNKMVPRYGESLSLMYMDTDSFVYHIHGRDFYTEMRNHLNDFDTSDYPQDHPCYRVTNKKVLGKFKDEANAVPVKGFVGLRAKMYAMKYGGKILKRAKGVKRYALSKKISYNDYIRCLKYGTTQRTAFRMIRSNEHELYTVEMNKVSLNAHDDKRFILPNKVDTLPHGHYKINFIVEDMDIENAPINLDHIVLDEDVHMSSDNDE